MKRFLFFFTVPEFFVNFAYKYANILHVAEIDICRHRFQSSPDNHQNFISYF